MTNSHSPYWGRHRASRVLVPPFTLSLRDVEDLLAQRGIPVSHETIRVWCARFGPTYAKRLTNRHGRAGNIWFLDEVSFVAVQGERRYLWRAIDQDDDTIEILVHKRKRQASGEAILQEVTQDTRLCARSHDH